MSEANPIRVFVSHCFAETDDYLRVFEFLESVDRFFYLNCSKPENVPASGGVDAIRDELIAQIKACEAVIVLASLFVEQTDMVRYQMDVAEANDKPTIAIRPRAKATANAIRSRSPSVKTDSYSPSSSG